MLDVIRSHVLQDNSLSHTKYILDQLFDLLDSLDESNFEKGKEGKVAVIDSIICLLKEERNRV